MSKPFATVDVSTSNIRGKYKDPNNPKTVKHVERVAKNSFKEEHPDKDPSKYVFKHKGPEHVEKEDYRPFEDDFNSYHKVDVHPKPYGEGHDMKHHGEGKQYGSK